MQTKEVFEGHEVRGDELSLETYNQGPHDERAPARAHRDLTRRERDDYPGPAVLYEAFDRWNADYFEGKLDQAMILISELSLRALGDYIAADANGLRSRIRLQPSLWKKGGWRLALDTLLHEMVHAYCYEVYDDEERGYRGHGPKFARKCNEISARLGLPEVSPKGRGGKPDCAHWPIRPDGYYGPNYPPPKNGKNGDSSSVDGDRTVEPKGRFVERLIRILAAIHGVSRAEYLRQVIVEQARMYADAIRQMDPELADSL